MYGTDRQRSQSHIFLVGLYNMIAFLVNTQCYYIGGTEDAATGMLSEVTKPMSYHLPPEKICEKLKKKDSQICELQYGKPC